MELTNILFYALIAIVSIAVYIIRGRLTHWEKRGVPHDKPSFPHGNLKGAGTTKHLSKPIREIYNKYKGTAPFCGVHFLLKPALIVTDLDLVKRILIKDFGNFVDRGVYHNEKDDPLSGHLFALDGGRWRQLRTKLTPTFTSGKMKFMYPTVLSVGQKFVKVFGEMVGESSEVEIKEVLARFTTDVIGTCAFGIECNSLKDPNAEFRVVGKKFFTEPRHSDFVIGLIRSFPDIARWLGCCMTPSSVHDFFMKAVRDTVKYREENGIVRNDFMNMLIELKNNKSFKTESGEVVSGLTMDELAAQAFVFFVAGFETSSSTMGFALYELAQNQEIQDRLRTEINETFAKYNGDLTYEAMKDLKYMDQVIYETLRKYPIVPFLNRNATKDYTVPDSKYKIEGGTMLIIPVDAIQHDPEIYPNPEVFDPERFSKEEVEKREQVAWLPFGDGPRNCIGLRFGKMQTRIGLGLLLKEFKFRLSSQMKVPFDLNPKGILLQIRGGIYLIAERV